MDIEISRPNIDETDEIHKLFSKTVENNFLQEEISDPSGSLKESIVNDLVKTLKKDFDSNGTNEFHLIAKKDNIIVGIIAYGEANQLIVDNVDINSLKTPELKSVYVQPKFQNCGIGKLLVNNILKCLKEKGYKEFCLDSGYLNAQRYWKKKFGNPVQIIDRYWTPNNHHMIWHLKMEDLNEI